MSPPHCMHVTRFQTTEKNVYDKLHKNIKCKEIIKLKWHREKDSNPHSHQNKLVCPTIRPPRYISVLLNPNSVLIFTRLVRFEYRFPPLVQTIGSAPIRVSYYLTTTNNKTCSKKYLSLTSLYSELCLHV